MLPSSGASRARTGDPLLAKQVLSQLSYGPFIRPRAIGQRVEIKITRVPGKENGGGG